MECRNGSVEWRPGYLVPYTVSPRENIGTSGRSSPVVGCTDFALPEPASVTLTVYDALGRIVQVLVDQDLEAGNHTAVWDGRDASGRSVASRTYLYRIEAGPYSSVHRMSLIK